MSTEDFTCSTKSIWGSFYYGCIKTRPEGPFLRLLHTLADVELQLPAAAVAGDTPELQHAGFGHDRFERHRHVIARSAIGGKLHLDRGEFFQIVSDVVDHGSRRVVLACGRVEETELGRLA